MNIYADSFLEQPVWVVLLAIAIIVTIGGIIYAIDKSRRTKIEKSNFKNYQESILKYNADDILENARKYKESHPNYNEVDLSSLHFVYYVDTIFLNGENLPRFVFAKFLYLSVRGDTLIATYKEEIPSGLFHGPSSKLRTVEMYKCNFNKNFFAEEVLAKEKIVNLLKDSPSGKYPYLTDDPVIL